MTLEQAHVLLSSKRPALKGAAAEDLKREMDETGVISQRVLARKLGEQFAMIAARADLAGLSLEEIVRAIE